MTNWEELHRLCMGCQRCALADTRTSVVFGKGPRDAKIMFIGEGPGENEDLQGSPLWAGADSCWMRCSPSSA